MRITTYAPWRALNDISDELNRFLTQDEDNTTVETSQWRPAVDIKEEAERFVILADLPGVDIKDIELAIDGSFLTIKGQREHSDEVKKEGFVRVERESGVFYRRFSLPETADLDKITAKSKHGVLEITIPKAEMKQTRRIDVEQH